MFCRRCGKYKKYNLSFVGICTTCWTEICNNFYIEFWDEKPLRYSLLIPIFMVIGFCIWNIWIYSFTEFPPLYLKMFIGIIITGIIIANIYKNYIFKNIKNNTYILDSKFKNVKEIHWNYLIIILLIIFYSILESFIEDELRKMVNFYFILLLLIVVIIPYIYLLIYEKKNGTVIMRKKI